MSKRTITINGNKVILDMNRPKVADLVVALVEACAERHFPIGMYLTHKDSDGGVTDYELVSIRNYAGGPPRAYLCNVETGIARNSTKVVPVLGTAKGKAGEDYYTTDIPAVNDKFFDPDNPGQLLDY